MTDDRRGPQEPTLGPTDVRNQHYVSQFYLKAFEDAASHQLSVWNLSTNKKFSSNVRNVGAQRDFNNVVVGDIEVSMESWLTELEGKAAGTIGRLLADPDELAKLNIIEQNDLGRLIASQHFRVPAFRTRMGEVRQTLTSEIRVRAEAQIRHLFPNDADERIEELRQKPEEWWLQESESHQEASTAVDVLEGLQGWANIVMAMPWRIGIINSHRLFTSDNPISPYTSPTAGLYSAGAFAAQTYFWALSPDVLLKIGPLPRSDAFPGPRERRDFSKYESSFTRHIIAANAEAFLCGPEPYNHPPTARQWIQQLAQKSRSDASRLTGWVQRP